MATAACCRRMSACFWSGCDERKTRGLDQRRRSHHLPILQRVREGAVFPPQLLCGLRGIGPGGKTRRRGGEDLRDVAGLPCRDAGDPRARSLQHCTRGYGGGLSHDGPWRQRPRHWRQGFGALYAVRRTAGSVFRKGEMMDCCGDVIASSGGASVPTSVHRGPSALPKIRPNVSVAILRGMSHGVDLAKEFLAILVILDPVIASKRSRWRSRASPSRPSFAQVPPRPPFWWLPSCLTPWTSLDLGVTYRSRELRANNGP